MQVDAPEIAQTVEVKEETVIPPVVGLVEAVPDDVMVTNTTMANEEIPVDSEAALDAPKQVEESLDDPATPNLMNIDTVVDATTEQILLSDSTDKQAEITGIDKSLESAVDIKSEEILDILNTKTEPETAEEQSPLKKEIVLPDDLGKSF